LDDPASIEPLIAETAIHRDIAVIDVGSNSVRLVHFRVEGRALWPIFNEKVMAGLGRGVRVTGKLHPEGRDIALRALKRFQRLLDAKGVRERYAVATAAVRNATDGPAFVEEVAELTGLKVRVLQGEEEAYHAALGLVAGVPTAHGVMGDLGGSSLELTPILNGVPQPGRTYALGPQEVIDGPDFDPDATLATIDERLAEGGMLSGQGGAFYAIGGAWRALAHLAFARFDYPLHVVHEFALSAEEVRELARLVTRLSPASLQGTPGLSSRRIETLPYAALLLRRIMRHGKFDSIVFSAYGVREGVLAAGLPPELLATDPLIAGAETMARPSSPSPDFGRALAAWIAPAMREVETAFDPARDRVLQEAGARLTDLGARFHPDHRAELSRDTILYAPFAGVTHAERAFLAAALHYRYAGKRAELDNHGEFHLLDETQHNVAQMMGCALRLGAKLSGRATRLLDQFTLTVTPEEVRLTVDESVRDLYVERSLSLLDNLAGAINRRAQVDYV
jgi:exopolyphosphatase/guanosine-5'-triphosphate,3'-diphosphate pyrophosphatase